MVFNYQKRKLLEEYLQKKVTVSRIAKGLKTSKQTVYKEIKLGLNPIEYESRKFEAYSADKAQKEIEKAVIAKVR